MRDTPEAEKVQFAVGELFAGACAGAALPGLLEAVERFRPNVVVRESQEYAAIVAAEKHRLPHVRVSITSRQSEKVVFSWAGPAIDEHRRGIGLPPDPETLALWSEPVLSLFPASLDPGDGSDGQTHRFRADRPAAAALPKWWPDDGSDAPFVYATLGTVAGGMDAMRPHFKSLLQALTPLRARVLLTVGAQLPEGWLGELPAHVRVERFVPQDEVLPHASVCVCHGGSGTVLGALAAGVPMVVLPLFADQPINAAQLAELGASVSFARGHAEPREITKAVERVLAEPAFRDAAQRLRDEIQRLPPVDEVAVHLHELGARG